MNGDMKAIGGAAVTGFVLFYVLTSYVFNPVMANDTPGQAMNPFLTLAVTSVVGVLILTWINASVRNPVKSGAIIAICQIALVDLYYPMGGQRGWTSAAVSAAVLLVGWTLVGMVYGKLSGAAPAEA